MVKVTCTDHQKLREEWLDRCSNFPDNCHQKSHELDLLQEEWLDRCSNFRHTGSTKTKELQSMGYELYIMIHVFVNFMNGLWARDNQVIDYLNWYEGRCKKNYEEAQMRVKSEFYKCLQSQNGIETVDYKQGVALFDDICKTAEAFRIENQHLLRWPPTENKDTRPIKLTTTGVPAVFIDTRTQSQIAEANAAEERERLLSTAEHDEPQQHDIFAIDYS